jgi:hypothetical protein
MSVPCSLKVSPPGLPLNRVAESLRHSGNGPPLTGFTMTSGCATVMERVRKNCGEFVQILCNSPRVSDRNLGKYRCGSGVSLPAYQNAVVGTGHCARPGRHFGLHLQVTTDRAGKPHWLGAHSKAEIMLWNSACFEYHQSYLMRTILTDGTAHEQTSPDPHCGR